MTLLVYDSTGILSANLITGEVHTPVSEPDIFANQGPFFATGLIVTGIPLAGGSAVPLVYGIDYSYSPVFVSQMAQTGKQIYSYILLTNYTHWSTITLQYQALGGGISDQVLLYQIFNAGTFDRTNLQNWLNFTGQQSTYSPTGVDDSLSNAGVATLLANKISFLASKL